MARRGARPRRAKTEEEMENDPRHEHNYAPRVIREIQGPRMRHDADEARERDPMIDELSYYGDYGRKGRGKRKPAFSYEGDEGPEPQSRRRWEGEGHVRPPRQEVRNRETAERLDRIEDALSGLAHELKALRTERKAAPSRSRKGRSKAKSDPDSMASVDGPEE